MPGDCLDIEENKLTKKKLVTMGNSCCGTRDASMAEVLADGAGPNSEMVNLAPEEKK